MVIRRGLAVVVTGVVAGIAVVLFHWSLEGLTYLLRAILGVKELVSPIQVVHLVGERLWVLPIAIFIGLCIAKLVSTASGVAGQRERGADRVIEAVNGSELDLPLMETLGTAVAGVIALGTGVSGGPEGPIAMLVGGPLLRLLSWCSLDDSSTRVFVAAGVGAALACIFRAPFAGVLLAGELFVLAGFVGAVIVPGLLVTAIAWMIDSVAVGGSPLIGHLLFGSIHAEAYVSAVVIGIIAGLIGLLYRWWIAVVAKSITRYSRSTYRRWLSVAIGVAAMTAGIGLVAPEVLSTGTGWIRLVTLLGAESRAWPLWLLLLVPVARIALTGLSLSAEAPIGVLGPALVIGAFSGVLLWRIVSLAHLPLSFGTLPLFAIIMFAAVFGSIGRIPLSMVVIALTATGSLTVAAAVMVAVAVALLVVQRKRITIFGSQVLAGRSPLSSP